MGVEDLPYLDEHCVDVRASVEATWDAAAGAFRSMGRGPVPLLARLLGCDPSTASGSASGPASGSAPGSAVASGLATGDAVPGFRVVASDRPHSLVLAGRHRFSGYAIVLRVEELPTGSRCRLESRGEFPGVHGRLYRLAVIGSRGHVLAVRGLLRGVRRVAEAGTSS
jgi:hypothetical protein